MGTGSGGGSGSGGSGGSGSGGGRGAGGYRSEGGRIFSAGISKNTARKEVSRIFARMQKNSGQYFDKQFSGPLIKAAFREIFAFSACFEALDPKQALVEKFGIPDGPGFLSKYADAMLSANMTLETDVRIRDTVQQTVGDVLFRTIGNDYATFRKGTCDTIIAKIDHEVLKRISGYFLWNLLWQVVLRDQERPGEDAEVEMRRQAEELANHIIEAAKGRFFNDRTSYPQLFDVIADQLPWFREETRSFREETQ